MNSAAAVAAGSKGSATAFLSPAASTMIPSRSPKCQVPKASSAIRPRRSSPGARQRRLAGVLVVRGVEVGEPQAGREGQAQQRGEYQPDVQAALAYGQPDRDD